MFFDGADHYQKSLEYQSKCRQAADCYGHASGAETIIWAVDDDGMSGLDTNLDNNHTGTIDEADAGGDDKIDNADGGLGTQIKMQKIRAVRIWIMARSNRVYQNYTNSGVFQVGPKVFKPKEVAIANGDNTDKFRYLVLSSSVHLRNREQLDVNQN